MALEGEIAAPRTLAFLTRAIAVFALLAVPMAMLYYHGSVNPNVNGKTELFRLLVVLMLVALPFTGRFRPTPILIVFAVYGAALGIADLRGDGWGLLHENFRYDGFLTPLSLLGYLAALSVLDDGWNLLLWAWVWSAAIVALSGLYATMPHILDGTFSRAGGIIPNPDFFAIYLLFGVFFALLLWPTGLKPLLGSIIGLLCVMIVFSASRSVLIALPAGLIVACRRRRRLLLGLCAVCLLGICIDQAVSSVPIIDRLMTGDARMAFWMKEFPIIGQHPWLGYGQGGSILIFGDIYLDRAHNLILDLLLEGGFVAAIAYGAVLLWSAIVADENRDHVALGGLVAYGIAMMFSFDTITSYVPLVTLLGWIGRA